MCVCVCVCVYVCVCVCVYVCVCLRVHVSNTVQRSTVVAAPAAASSYVAPAKVRRARERVCSCEYVC